VWLVWPQPAWVRLVAVPLLLPVLWAQPARPAAGEFELVAADVGQGSGVLVRTAHASLLYDAGPQWAPGSDAGQRVLLPLIRSLGDAPATLVLSHSDSDHVGGAVAVLNAGPGAEVLASFEPAELHRPHSTLTTRWRLCTAGQHWEQDGVRFEVVHPAQALYGRGLSTNAMSCVLWVQGRSGSALLTGDLDARQEAALVQSHPGLRASLLLSPHHGSRTSSSEGFLRMVQPLWVVVQAGYRNRYGHPAPEVTGRYERLGLPWLGTPACGALRWQSQSPTQAPTCWRTENPRHWHWRTGVGAEEVSEGVDGG
jgi:competence protein ComEC